MENVAQVEPVKKNSFWHKLGLVLLLLLGLSAAAYALLGFILLPKLAKENIELYVEQSLGRELRLHDIRFNPFNFSTRLNGVELREADGTLLLSFRSLSVDLHLQELIKGVITLSEIELLAPWIHLKIDNNGELNLARFIGDAIAGADNKTSTESAAESALHFLIKRLRIHNGTVKVTDLSGANPTVAHLLPINLELDQLSNQPGTKAPVSLTATANGGGSLHWEGDLSLQPLLSQGRVQLKQIRALTLWEFFQDKLNIDLPQGFLDLEAGYSFSQTESARSLVVEALQLQLSDLLLRRKGAADSLLSLETIALADGRFELEGNRLAIGQIRVANGTVSVTREKRFIDWGDLISRTEDNSSQSDKREDAGAGQDWSAELQRLSVENVALVFGDRDLNRPVASSIGRADLILSANAQQTDGQLSAGVNGIELTLKQFSMTRTGMPDPLLVVNEAQLHQGRMDLASQSIVIDKVELKGGQTRVVREKNGHFDWESVWAQKEAPQSSNQAVQQPAKPWRVEVATVLLDGFNVALSDQTNVTPAELHLSPVNLKLNGISSSLDKPIAIDLGIAIREGGELAIKGSLDAAKPGAELDVAVKQLSLLPLRPYLQPVVDINLGSGHLSTSGQLSYAKSGKDALSYNGTARIDDLLITEPETGETLLGWKRLDATELTFSLKPDSLLVKEILLSEPAGKFVIDKDQSTNWQKIVKEEPGEGVAAASAAAKAVFPVGVERIQIDSGKLDFSDFSLPLAFSTKVHELNGAIVGISTEPGAKASSDLQGKVDEFGSAKIKGDIAPFDPLLFTDMHVVFANLNMVSLTPYTSKFAGYAIDSGKLSLDLRYKINGKKLQGENQIVLNKLKLGKKVESPDAIDAPIELAIALMQDSRGIIDLGLPIRGNLDDPEFSYGHLVAKAIGNLFTKIVTAPFRVLGALFGVAGDDLDLVAFEPGSAALAPPEQEKLIGVAKVLSERPKLVLEIQGQYDKKADGDALREWALRADIGKRLGRKLAPGKAPDPISLTDSKTRAALEELFASRISAAELAQLKTPAKPQQGSPDAKGDTGQVNAVKGREPEQAVSLAPDLYEKLYRRLVDAQPLAADALQKLALGRGEAIVQGVKKSGKLPDARIRLLNSTPVTVPEEGKVISKLNLGVGN